MKGDEWVGVIPVPAGCGTSVHENHAGILRLRDNLIGEGHAGCASTDDQVVGLQVLDPCDAAPFGPVQTCRRYSVQETD